MIQTAIDSMIQAVNVSVTQKLYSDSYPNSYPKAVQTAAEAVVQIVVEFYTAMAQNIHQKQESKQSFVRAFKPLKIWTVNRSTIIPVGIQTAIQSNYSKQLLETVIHNSYSYR